MHRQGYSAKQDGNAAAYAAMKASPLNLKSGRFARLYAHRERGRYSLAQKVKGIVGSTRSHASNNYTEVRAASTVKQRRDGLSRDELPGGDGFLAGSLP